MVANIPFSMHCCYQLTTNTNYYNIDTYTYILLTVASTLPQFRMNIAEYTKLTCHLENIKLKFKIIVSDLCD